MLKKILALGAVLLLAAPLVTGCKNNTQDAEVMAAIEEAGRREGTDDPRAAIDEIYAAIEDANPRELTAVQVMELLDLEEADLSEFYCFTTEVIDGLNNLFVIRAEDSETGDRVRKAMVDYQENLVREYQSYDILNASTIARGAIVKEHGDYVILLMMEDNQAAQDILFDYLPQ